MARSVFVLMVLVVALLPGCSKDEPTPPSVQQQEAVAVGLLEADSSLDLVVVSIDTLRADRLPFYGAERATAGKSEQPWSLAWMAERGTIFDSAWAPAGMTLPSFGSFWTGLPPIEHGAMGNHQRVLARTYAMDLAEQGWKNHAVVSNWVLRPGSGMDRGFASYQVCAKEQEATGPALLLASTERVIKAKQRSLIWAHYMAPHQPYLPHSEHLGKFSTADGSAGDRATLERIHADPSSTSEAELSHLRGLYDEEILTANDYVVQFLSGLDAQYQAAGRGSLLDNAVVIVMSDHGEDLADHEHYFMHAKSLYAGVTQVPLMILGGDWQGGQRHSQGIALADVLPLVLHGRSPQAKTFFSAWRDEYFVARDERWTLVHNPSNNMKGPQEPPKHVAFVYPQVALFDRHADPLELTDVAARNPAVTRRLLDALHDWYFDLERADGEVVISAEDIKALEELGYAGGDEELEIPLTLPWSGAQWNP